MSEDLAFFHGATMKICGSLDVDRAVRESAAYLKKYIPLKGIMLSTYEPEKGCIRILSMFSDIPTAPWSTPVYMSPGSRKLIETSDDGVIFYEKADTNPVSVEVSRALDMPSLSGILMHLKLDDKKLGVVLIFSDKQDVFTPEHSRLTGLLHDPFAIAIANVIRHREVLHLKDMLADDNKYFQQELRYISGDEIIGARYGLRDVMEMVRQVAPLNSHVMLTGETGVGKEVIANAIHYSSNRREGPLVKVNCGAFTENLLDSELFGHEKGAFTGAIRSKRGRFERAHGGTLFLDEMGELPLSAQVKLLRVLQDGIIERVGGQEPIKVDVRIIAATHRNLSEMVKEGTFREDLLFRLNVFPIHIPPLRLRRSDIPALVHHFIDRKLKLFNMSTHPVLAAGAMEQLKAYQWPGNVRELENIIERALIRHQSEAENTPLNFEFLTEDQITGVINDQAREEDILHMSLDQAIRIHIEKVLQHTGGKIQGKDGAAAVLGLHPSTLRSRMDKLGIAFGRKAMHL